jgi:small subunit ribosomal protein S17e
MGRIRGKEIRNATVEVLKLYRTLFTDNFEGNKEALNKVITAQKRNRNKIAGFITKLAKEKAIEEFIIEHSSK